MFRWGEEEFERRESETEERAGGTAHGNWKLERRGATDNRQPRYHVQLQPTQTRNYPTQAGTHPEQGDHSRWEIMALPPRSESREL